MPKEVNVMKTKEDKPWSPYVAGALSGFLIILSVWGTGNFFGTSTTFVRGTGMIEKIFGPEYVAGLEYFTKFVPQIDWQWMFVVGIAIGSFISAIMSGSFKWKGVPDMWEARFGPSGIKRGVVAFAGGIIAMFGARMAGG